MTQSGPSLSCDLTELVLVNTCIVKNMPPGTFRNTGGGGMGAYSTCTCTGYFTKVKNTPHKLKFYFTFKFS